MKAESLNYWNESDLDLNQEIYGDIRVGDSSSKRYNLKSYFQLNMDYRNKLEYNVDCYSEDGVSYYYSSVLDLVDLINII